MKNVNSKSAFLSVAAALVVSAVGSQALALGQNLPNLADQSSVGRMPIFLSPKGLSWFLPLALSSEIECSPESSSPTAKRSCIVRVMNNYSADESDALHAFEKEHQTSVMALSPLDRSTVASVTDTFNENDKEDFLSEMKLSTFVMQSEGAYANGIMRADQKTVAEKIEKYKTTGLGTFTSEVVLRGETVGEYIAIMNPEVLRDALAKLDGRYSLSTVKVLIGNTLKQLQLNVYGVDHDQALSDVATQVRKTFFGVTPNQKYAVLKDRIRQLHDRYLIEDDSTPEYQEKCTVTLELKDGATSTAVCEKVDP